MSPPGKNQEMCKRNLLRTLIKENCNLAPQGSPEWLALRPGNIGGSEMSTITGDKDSLQSKNS